ncbi:aldehyde dehydrogenase family protein [Pseudonocardia sp. GCM10023141]|uniref:aldehyde dehydrogenase family protein n=1 Tax=Pseudonocardia sp. GCM10023141 TaxID=3252653 RepID=UPI003618F91B
MHESRMLIDGVLGAGVSGRRFENVNPATEEVLGSVADGVAGDMDAAIGAARRAFDTTSWSADRDFRAHCLRQLHDALGREREAYRSEIIGETGSPKALTYATQVDVPIDDAIAWPLKCMDFFGWERDLGTAQFLGQTSRRIVAKVAVGVVGAIVPWNYPLEVTLNKLGQALATGNTIVLKPAPDTPFNATRLGRLIVEQTDIPAGVVNVVTSSDHALGEQLVVDDRVDMVSFTGSTATGSRIMEKAAPSLKRLFLELGGKSAAIVLDDADLAAAARGAVAAVSAHAGQGCVIATRLLVPRHRYAEAVEAAAAEMAAVPYGDPLDPAVTMGPVVSARQRDRVLGLIEAGKAEGARLVTGGSRPRHLPRGYFVEPTLFADVDNSMRVAREEIFGPVLVVIPFADDDDAVRIANDSHYGLGGAVSSADLDRAMSVARRVRTGVQRINGGNWYAPDSPFGGFKRSGLGRQNGLEGFEQYLETMTFGLPV